MRIAGRLYLEHLSEADLGLLAAVDRSAGGRHRDPDQIEALLDSPAVFDRLFRTPGRDPLLQGSPFLAFAVLVHRVIRDLRQASFVDEWVGPRQRVPVFEVGGLRQFGADPLRRLFLAELLASYTHVASGSVMVQTSRGWRRRRFSELDPIRMVELAELVPAAERPSVYRRLGDLSLFLTGVFPDYAAERLVTDRERRRLASALLAGGQEAAESRDGVWLLERLGRHAYRLAERAADHSGLMGRVLAEVADEFASARRLLNVLTDRYLFPLRRQWFGAE